MGQLGDTLRDRRISLGISLETAENETKIRARLLAALEAGEYDKLPDPGYVRGYVSSYARYLELDPIPLLAMHRAETGVGRHHDINVPEPQLATRNEQHAVPWRVGVIAFLIVAVLVAGGWLVYRAFRGPSKPPPIPSTTSSVTPGVTQTNGAPPFTLKVTVSANGASSLKVTVDGASAYNGTLAGGQSQTFQVTDTAELKIGKPSQVTVTRNGTKVAVPGTAPATITLRADQP
ncbi:MAG TPA: RodZ domain-containing protein [Coriobacteriia bacterium]